MPGFNGTGPNGLGTGTGRKAGKCFGSSTTNVSSGGRMMNGNGRGLRGRGFRCNINNSNSDLTSNTAADELQAQPIYEDLDQRLSKIENTLEKLIEQVNIEPENKSDA